MKKKLPLLIDTDAGADDLLALNLLIASRYPISAILPSYGSFPVHDSISRIRNLLKNLQAGDELTITTGAAKPLKKPYQPYYRIHGKNSSGDNTPPNQTIRPDKLIVSTDTKFDYLCLGPLTNLSKLISHKSNILKKINRIFIMGGAIQFPGNATPLAEANFFWDPDAVEQVFQQAAPKIYLVPLNITEKIQLTEQDIKHLKSKAVFSKIFKPYLDYYLNEKKWYLESPGSIQKNYRGAAIHDVVPAAALLKNKIIHYQTIDVSTSLVKKHPGYIYPVLRNEQRTADQTFPIKIATQIDEKLFWNIFDKILKN